MIISNTAIPRHVVVIPDGNRRWARKKGLKPWIGHQEGAKNFELVLEKAAEMKIPYLTFWAGSLDNLTKRPKMEVNFLFQVYKNYFEKTIGDERIHKNQVKISVLGRWKEILPPKVKEPIEKAMATTKNYHQFFLTFLIAYNGTDEMLDCVRKIVKLSNPYPLKITEKTIKENLWTKDLPDVDLIIRTGCANDPHNSAGFMMWQTAYSQFYFTKTLFPDFTAKDFEKIIKNYSFRQRRFGK